MVVTGEVNYASCTFSLTRLLLFLSIAFSKVLRWDSSDFVASFAWSTISACFPLRWLSPVALASFAALYERPTSLAALVAMMALTAIRFDLHCDRRLCRVVSASITVFMLPAYPARGMMAFAAFVWPAFPLSLKHALVEESVNAHGHNWKKDAWKKDFWNAAL